MGFELRINFTDIIQTNSLRNTYFNGVINGFKFDIRLSYYRGLYLSCIDQLKVSVDHLAIEDEQVLFHLNGKEFTIAQLPYVISEFWAITKPATLEIHQPSGLAAGLHEIELTLMLRSPYLPLPGSDEVHAYAPINSCDTALLELQGGKNHESN